MQKFVNILVLTGLAAAVPFTGCASKQDVVVQTIATSAPSFAEVQGKVWALEEIVSDAGGTVINRQKLELNGKGDVFTLRVDEDMISGKGAPNRYSSPYTLNGQEISISPIKTTLMMSIGEPEDIQEREFYDYLEQVNQWELIGDKLELHSETPDGDPVIMIFTCEEQ
jgi:heat shock protein HslJ